VLQKKPEHELLILGFIPEIMLVKLENLKKVGWARLGNLEKYHNYTYFF
jgi:hypothetical protein